MDNTDFLIEMAKRNERLAVALEAYDLAKKYGVIGDLCADILNLSKRNTANKESGLSDLTGYESEAERVINEATLE
ncbi:MAG: hypothetical protein ABL927_13455 [Bdellovibrionales bacterium]